MLHSNLLDHTGREYDAFTPVTMELPEESGIEPDYCFYIDNWEALSGKERINWSIYQLQGREYILQTQIRYLPTMSLQELVARCLRVTYERNTSAAIRELRQGLDISQ